MKFSPYWRVTGTSADCREGPRALVNRDRERTAKS